MLGIVFRNWKKTGQPYRVAEILVIMQLFSFILFHISFIYVNVQISVIKRARQMKLCVVFAINLTKVKYI